MALPMAEVLMEPKLGVAMSEVTIGKTGNSEQSLEQIWWGHKWSRARHPSSPRADCCPTHCSYCYLEHGCFKQ